MQVCITKLCTEQYCLVFWEDEDAVTVVPAKSVKDDVVVGGTREVAVGKNTYTGKIQAVGKLYYHSWMHYNISCNT